MDKTIQDRFKRNKDLEEVNSKMADALSMVADKYGIDPSSEGYLDNLTNAIKDDNSYVESYAMDHDMSPEEARKSLDMQRKISRYEAEKRAEEQRQAQNYQMQRLMASAEKTKELYPDFDLDMEMQNEEFRIICAATQGDTTKAYRSVHGDEIFQKMAKDITEKANQQIANTVAANRSRPVEGGLSSQAAMITAPNFESMTAEELKAWGEEQMAKGR